MSSTLRKSHAGDRPSQGRAAASSTGAAVRNVLPVLVESGEPPEQLRGRGTAPSRATANINVASEDAVPVRGLGNPRGSPTASGNSSQRMHWTRELNMSVMRAYYRSTKNETECEGFRKRLLTEWRNIYPESTLNEQRVCSQLNSIRRRKVFSDAELNLLKAEVRLELTNEVVLEQHANENEQNEQIEQIEQNEHGKGHVAVSTPQLCNDILHDSLNDIYEATKLHYQGMPLDLRPKIPKLKCSANVYEIIGQVDKLIAPNIIEASSLEEVAGLVHCAAIATCQHLGYKVRVGNGTSLHKKPFERQKPPMWLKKIENQIAQARRDISHIAEYFRDKGGISVKIRASIRSILRRLKVRRTQDDLERRLKMEDERLRQRIVALGARIRRYNEAATRKKENNLFSSNQKGFYRYLESRGTSDNDDMNLPSASAMKDFWSEIWSIPKQHAEEAYWIQQEEYACRNIPEMSEVFISTEDVKRSIKRTHNWKAPGVDGIHNFWWKYLTCTHEILANQFQNILQGTSLLPDICTLGMTYMLPKGGNMSCPQNYRPITCLPTVYKVLTSIIATKLDEHLKENELLLTEQGGCRKGSRGCKELLIIDNIVSKHVKRKSHNLSVGWIDFRKAFDSIPHSWLQRTLQLYKVHPAIINFLTTCMKSWRTTLHVMRGKLSYHTDEVKICRGIFQGDSLSPLWFCLALKPLSRMLNDSGYGYALKNPQKIISHQLYMDDLKLYAKGPEQLQSLLTLVESFSSSICMDLGLEKCAVVHVKRGHVQNTENGSHLMEDLRIQELGKGDEYKYLGLQQLLGTADDKIRKQVERKVLSRVTKICKSCINSRNKFTGINTWALSAASHTFGVVKWSDTSLQVFDRKVRTILTKHRMHHPRSSTERLYLSRYHGGRGLLSLEVMCRQQEKQLRNYFINNGSMVAICAQDQGYTPLKLLQEDYNPTFRKPQDRIEQWRSKELHGRFATALRSDNIDMKRSTEWLRTAGLFGETEGFVLAIQDQVVATNNYRRHIMKENICDKCRLCKKTTESIQHICNGCSELAQTEYLQRHNNVAKIIHQALARESDLIKENMPYYKYLPEQVLSNERAKILWDTAIVTDRPVEANKPDIVVFDKTTRRAIIIDVAVPLDHNLLSTIAEKKRKYQPLAIELKDLYQLQEVDIVPVVISSNGLVPKGWGFVKEKLHLHEWHFKTMQKAVLLATTNIVRKVLSLSN